MKLFKNSVTVPSPPDEEIFSGWGRISMRRWCELVAKKRYNAEVIEVDGLVFVIDKEV